MNEDVGIYELGLQRNVSGAARLLRLDVKRGTLTGAPMVYPSTMGAHSSPDEEKESNMLVMMTARRHAASPPRQHGRS